MEILGSPQSVDVHLAGEAEQYGNYALEAVKMRLNNKLDNGFDLLKLGVASHRESWFGVELSESWVASTGG